MKNKATLPVIIALFILSIAVFIGSLFYKTTNDLQYESIALKPVNSQIMADGVVSSQNETTLHFQTAGKLTSLPFKEGDAVKQGQTIAQLDTYLLQKQLTTALNNYRSTRDTFDQTQQNQDKGITQNTQRGSLNAVGAGISQYGTDTSSTSYLDDVAKRIVDQNQANLDNSVINVQSANYALQLSSLTSPIDGVITHEDVVTAGVNVTPATSFIISDPNSLVFKANVSENDIDFVSQGSMVTIKIGGVNGRTLSGTVAKIYPQKVTLTNGDKVYQVDITSTDLKSIGQLGQTGSALIQSNTNTSVILVPSWTVLSNQYIWVVENGKAQLRQVHVGKTHGKDKEILSGLNPDDKIITNPETIAKNRYPVL